MATTDAIHLYMFTKTTIISSSKSYDQPITHQARFIFYFNIFVRRIYMRYLAIVGVLIRTDRSDVPT